MTPLEMVLATEEPIVTAPKNSKMDPNTKACFSVNAPAPTLVPMELAMSLAPLANASRNENINPKYSSASSCVGFTCSRPRSDVPIYYRQVQSTYSR